MLIKPIFKFIISQKEADELYNSCNEQYFDYELDFIPVVLVDDPDNAGNFKFDIDLDNDKIINQRIEISIHKKRSIDAYISTMVHELIHYKVISQLDKKSLKKAFKCLHEDDNMNAYKILYINEFAHSNKWLEIANDINNTYNIKINKV